MNIYVSLHWRIAKRETSRNLTNQSEFPNLLSNQYIPQTNTFIKPLELQYQAIHQSLFYIIAVVRIHQCFPLYGVCYIEMLCILLCSTWCG